jgi:hypothetical protein
MLLETNWDRASAWKIHPTSIGLTARAQPCRKYEAYCKQNLFFIFIIAIETYSPSKGPATRIQVATPIQKVQTGLLTPAKISFLIS